MLRTILGAAAGIVLLVPVAMAETVRCNDRIVEEGMTQAEVLEHCGQPDEKDMVNDYAWIYRRGDSMLDTRFDFIIHFYANGKVRVIETVDE